MIDLAERDMTLLVYLAGDNNLHDAAKSLYREFQKVIPPAGSAIAIQCDLLSSGNSGSASFRSITDSQATNHKQMGPLDSSAVATLADFLYWGITASSSRRHVLWIFGHSDGLLCMLDDETSRKDMVLPEFREALELAREKSGKGLDAIIFDCCWMTMAEVLYEIEGLCDYILGCQDEMPGWGIAVQSVADLILMGESESLVSRLLRILQVLALTPLLGLRKKFLFAPTFSLVQACSIGSLKKALDEIAVKILSLSPAEMARFLSIVKKTQAFGNFAYRKDPYTSFIDIYDLLSGIILEPLMPAGLRRSASSGMIILEQMVCGHLRWGKETARSHGLSIFFPTGGMDPEVLHRYRHLRWAQESPWEKVFARCAALAKERI